jgi:uncharacterized protein with PIN domain
MKIKITEEGQRCRHCGDRVVRQTHNKMPKYKKGGYYFLWWFRCPQCKAMYMVEEAKVYFDLAEPEGQRELELQDDRIQ